MSPTPAQCTAPTEPPIPNSSSSRKKIHYRLIALYFLLLGQRCTTKDSGPSVFNYTCCLHQSNLLLFFYSWDKSTFSELHSHSSSTSCTITHTHTHTLTPVNQYSLGLSPFTSNAETPSGMTSAELFQQALLL